MARALILAAVLLAGCVDFIEPEMREPPEKGGFRISALVFRDSLRLDATLTPGRDGDAVRAVIDSTLWIGDAAVEPHATQPDPFSVAYHATMQFEDTIVAITLPAVAGVAGLGPYVLPVVQRTGPESLQVAPGESIVLHLQVPETAAGPATRSWDLLAGGGPRTFHASGLGAPPATLEIPAAFVPDTGTWPVMLTDEHHLLEPLEQAQWDVAILAVRRLLWTVTVEPAP